MTPQDPFGSYQPLHMRPKFDGEPDAPRLDDPPRRPQALEELREHQRAFDQRIAEIQAARQARVEREDRRQTAYYFHGRQGEQLAGELYEAEMIVAVEVGAIALLVALLAVATLCFVKPRKVTP